MLPPLTNTNAELRRHLLLLAVACVLAFWWQLGALGLIDPDEPFYAQTAREMLARRDWLTPYMFGAPQFEKPVLFYWLAMIAFKLFGFTEFAARSSPALFGSALVFLTYWIGRRMFSATTGLCAALALATSVAAVALTRIMLTDVVFAFFVSASIASYWMACENERRRALWIGAYFACSGLAVLTKGPLGTLIPALTLLGFHWRSRRPSPVRGWALVWGPALYAVIAVPWFAAMYAKFGWAYIDTFFIHENWERFIRAEHPGNNHWFYYLLVLAVGFIPWMPQLAVLLMRVRKSERSPQRALLGSWLLANLVFMSIAQSKLPSYAYFLFVPLALLAGGEFESLLREGFRSRIERIVFIALGALQAVPLLIAPLVRDEVRGAVMIALVAAGALIALGTLLQWRAPSFTGVIVSSASTVALICVASTFAAPEIDSYASVRYVADALREQRRDPTEPIVTDRLLARGVLYYLGGPVIVATSKPNPFWTPQPVEMLIGTPALDEFVAQHGSALCLFRPGEWEDTHSTASVPTQPQYAGQKVVMRVGAGK